MRIKTERLVLVPVKIRHIKDIFEHFNSDVITYMFPCVAKDISETREVVQEFIRQRRVDTDYVYAITLKSTEEFLGIVGLHGLKNEVPELGIWTKIGSHGNHYGREAIGGAIEYARELGIKKVRYPVDRRNVSSRKIPIYYGGKLVTEYIEVKTKDGRILEEVIYEIEL